LFVDLVQQTGAKEFLVDSERLNREVLGVECRSVAIFQEFDKISSMKVKTLDLQILLKTGWRSLSAALSDSRIIHNSYGMWCWTMEIMISLSIFLNFGL
jgi:hypothetical protein